MTGSAIPLSPRLLDMLLQDRRRTQAREDYALHALWLAGLNIFTLAGGEHYPFPCPAEALSSAQEDRSSAGEIRTRLLRLLQRAPQSNSI